MSVATEVRAIFKDVSKTARNPDLQPLLMIYGGGSISLFAYSIAALPMIDILAAIVTAIVFLPFVEYVLHRHLLHLLALAKAPALVDFWERVHYAHHMDPTKSAAILSHPASAFASVALYCALYHLASPFSVIPLAAAALALFAVYELVHFSCHTKDKLASGYFVERRRSHALHHHFDENRNFGVTSAVADRLFRTRLTDTRGASRSPTTSNLGYTGEFAERFPHLRDKLTRRKKGTAPDA